MTLIEFAERQQFMVRNLADKCRKMQRVQPGFSAVGCFLRMQRTQSTWFATVSPKEFMEEFYNPNSFSNF